jgi:serine/threonine protein phosphatase PrpC
MEVKAEIWSETGKRSRNEDYVAVARGDAAHGLVAALADGVGGHRGGRVAAELAVRGFIDGYLGQETALGVRVLAARALAPLNRWIHAVGQVDPELESMACTFTALILRGRSAHLMHVGDSRLYLLRDGSLQRLTTDHVLERPGLSHVLTRAVGLSPDIAVAWEVVPAREGDRFLLCSDGVHGVLRDREIAELLGSGDCGTASSALVRAALGAGSRDNATACVLELVALPVPDQGDIEMALSGLPVLPALRVGQGIDGFVLDRALSNGRDSLVFVARDKTQADVRCVLKLAQPGAPEDQIRRAFAREAWILARIHSPWVGEVIDLPPGRRSALYLAMPFYDGETLERRLRRPPRLSLPEGLSVGIRLGKAVAALHRAGIIHRDIKPENVVLTVGGGLRLIDLGVARLPRLEEEDVPQPPGTPPGTASFRAPEMLAGNEPGSEASDQFALGVTVFRAFTGAYPYGEIEPFSHPRFGAPASLVRARPDLPPWLDAVLRRAIAVSPEDRFGDVIEFVFALEHGAERPGLAPASPVPLFARDPLRFWQALCAVLALLLLLSLALRP